MATQQSDETIRLRELAADLDGSDWGSDEEITKVEHVEPLPPPRQTHSSVIDTGASALVRVLSVLPPWSHLPGLLALLGAGVYLAVRIWG